MTGDDDLLVATRRALLDALEALGPHADSVVVVGAQAVYLRAGGTELAIAEVTKDADLALDSRDLADDPRVEEAMKETGFSPDPISRQPGAWRSPTGMPVDLMVPEALAGAAAKNRRGSRLPPHANRSMRRTPGLEACVVDCNRMTIEALDPAHDARAIPAKVAGAAGLLVAKLHKVGERLEEDRKIEPKDAHDIYRLLVSRESSDLAGSFEVLLADDVSTAATGIALSYLRRDFTDMQAAGAQLAGQAERGVGDPEQTAASTAALAQELLAALED